MFIDPSDLGHATHELYHLRDMASPPRIHIICTGAGADFQERLWHPAGASAYFVGGMFPYDQEATADVLGFHPAKFVSVDTAIYLAQASYQKACLAKRPGKTVGIGMTCSVASTKEHRGDHKIIVAGMTNDKCVLAEYTLPKAVGTVARTYDGVLASLLGFKVLFNLLKMGGIKDNLPNPPGFEGVKDCDGLNRNLFFRRPYFTAHGTRIPEPDSGDNIVFLPGTFNPLHFGHSGMMQKAVEASGNHGIYSIEAEPPHKPTLSVGNMLERSLQFKGKDLLFTRGDALFLDKARSFNNADFAIGADTWYRLLDQKWSTVPVEDMLQEFCDLGIHFYVVDRPVNGIFITSDDFPLDDKFKNLYSRVSPSWSEVSSTMIREQNG